MSLLCPICKRYNKPVWEHGEGKCNLDGNVTIETGNVTGNVTHPWRGSKQERWEIANKDRMLKHRREKMREYRKKERA